MTETAKAPAWDMEDALGSYLSEIAKSTPLSASDEVELAQRIKDGDEVARNYLVEANLRFVVSVAKEYQNRGVHWLILLVLETWDLLPLLNGLTKIKGLNLFLMRFGGSGNLFCKH